MRVLTLEVSVYNVYITNQFKPTLLKGRGVKAVSNGDCEWQGGKLLRLLSQLRPTSWSLLQREVCGLSLMNYILFLTGSDKVRQKDLNTCESRFQSFNCEVFIYFLTP